MATAPLKAKKNQSIKKPLGVGNPVRKRLYTLKQSAAYLGRSEWAMRELIWAGRIPVVRPDGGRKIFVDIEDLMEFIEKNKSNYL